MDLRALPFVGKHDFLLHLTKIPSLFGGHLNEYSFKKLLTVHNVSGVFVC